MIDFGDAQVFTAIAYPSIILLRNAKPNGHQTRAWTWQPGPPVTNFAAMFAANHLLIDQQELAADGWRLESPAVLRLLDKLRSAGKPLGEYVDGRFYYGIKTGFNEAFVVDRATRDRLIAEHPSSAEVLKPFLRGRDVKRWRVAPQDLWLISTRHGIDIKKYPAIHQHLQRYKKQLTPGGVGGRKAGSYKWYEIQDNIAYWKEFEEPKILYQEIATYQAFAWDESGAYSNNKTFLIPIHEKYLLALLNSKAVWFFLGNIASKLQGGAFAMQTPYVSQVPVPSGLDITSFLRLADQILVAKCANPAADVAALEAEIDALVYGLYGLTSEEIAIVEHGTRRKEGMSEAATVVDSVE